MVQTPKAAIAQIDWNQLGFDKRWIGPALAVRPG
jgi:hypothetical protein